MGDPPKTSWTERAFEMTNSWLRMTDQERVLTVAEAVVNPNRQENPAYGAVIDDMIKRGGEIVEGTTGLVQVVAGHLMTIAEGEIHGTPEARAAELAAITELVKLGPTVVLEGIKGTAEAAGRILDSTAVLTAERGRANQDIIEGSRKIWGGLTSYGTPGASQRLQEGVVQAFRPHLITVMEDPARRTAVAVAVADLVLDVPQVVTDVADGAGVVKGAARKAASASEALRATRAATKGEAVVEGIRSGAKTEISSAEKNAGHAEQTARSANPGVAQAEGQRPLGVARPAPTSPAPVTSVTTPGRRATRPTAEFGDVKPHRKQGRAIWRDGERISEHEHVRARINLVLTTLDPVTNTSPYTLGAYGRSATITIPEDMARLKTRMDLQLRDRLKAALAKDELPADLAKELHLDADAHRAMAARDQTIMQRKAAGLPYDDLEKVTDAKILDATRQQTDELFKVGKTQRSPIAGADAEELERAFSTWQAGDAEPGGLGERAGTSGTTSGTHDGSSAQPPPTVAPSPSKATTKPDAEKPRGPVGENSATQASPDARHRVAEEVSVADGVGEDTRRIRVATDADTETPRTRVAPLLEDAELSEPPAAVDPYRQTARALSLPGGGAPGTPAAPQAGGERSLRSGTGERTTSGSPHAATTRAEGGAGRSTGPDTAGRSGRESAGGVPSEGGTPQQSTAPTKKTSGQERSPAPGSPERGQTSPTATPALVESAGGVSPPPGAFPAAPTAERAFEPPAGGDRGQAGPAPGGPGAPTSPKSTDGPGAPSPEKSGSSDPGPPPPVDPDKKRSEAPVPKPEPKTEPPPLPKPQA